MTIAGNVRGLVAFSGLTLNTVIWVVPLISLAILKLPVPHKPTRRAVTRWQMAIGEHWVSVNGLILGLGRAGVLDLRTPEDLNRLGWYLVISNHQTWSDVVILQAAFNKRIPFLKFFIKQELIWFPLLGLAWWALDMPFMKRYSKSYLARHPEKKGRDFEATRQACEKFSETPTSVINFIEGTRFSHEKRENRKSPFRNLLPPKAGGIALAMSSMGHMFDAILDVTIVYPERAVTFWDLCRGRLDRVVVDVRKRAVENWLTEGDYARDRQFRSCFHRWLTGIWSEKDSRIAELQHELSTRPLAGRRRS